MSTVTDPVRTVATTEPTSHAVVAAVASETGTDPMALEPLYDVFDPDALDALFAADGAGSGTARVEFVYGGCEVCVRDDGSVDATAISDS